MYVLFYSDLVEELGAVIHDALDQRKGDVSSQLIGKGSPPLIRYRVVMVVSFNLMGCRFFGKGSSRLAAYLLACSACCLLTTVTAYYLLQHRKRRRRETLRVQVTRVFALNAEHGCFHQSPMARTEKGEVSSVFLEFIEGIK